MYKSEDKLLMAQVLRENSEEELTELLGSKVYFVAKHRFDPEHRTTQKVLAAKLGVSTARVGQHEIVAIRKVKRHYNHWSSGLSLRSSQALINLGCNSPEDVARLYREKRLLGVKNLGKKSLEEIEKWLGPKHTFDVEGAINVLKELGYTIIEPPNNTPQT